MASQAESGSTQDPHPLPPDPFKTARSQFSLSVGVTLLLFITLAFPTLTTWWTILNQRPLSENTPQYLTVLFLLGRLWQAGATRKHLPPVNVSGNRAGILALGITGLVYVVSVCLSIKVLMFTSLLALLASLCRISLGRVIFQRCIPGFLFALFLLPQFPTDIRTAISLPLQLISTQLATGLASLFIPIQTLGNIFYIRGEAFEVTVACSGLNTWVGYLFAGMLGMFMGHFSWGRMLRLLIGAPLLALTGNALRLWITALVAYWVSADTGMAIHTNLEFVLFPLGLWGMVLAERAIQRRWLQTPAMADSALTPGDPVSERAANAQTNINAVNPEWRPARFTTKGTVLLVLMLITLGVWLPQFNPPADSTNQSQSGKTLPAIPMKIGDWKGHDLPLLHDEASILAPAQLTSREYQLQPGPSADRKAPQSIIWLNLLEATSMNTLHNLVDSLIASGAKPTLQGTLTLSTPKGPLKASWYHCVDETGKPYYLLLWYEWPGGNADNRWLWYWHVLSLKLQKREPTWRLVEIAAPASENDASPAQAQKLAQLKAFAAELYAKTTP